jgi:hypothetical protein
MSEKFLPAEEYKQHLDAAHKMVSLLCNGTKTWTMHVPVDERNDPDVVIGQALRDADRAVEMLETVQVNGVEARAFRSLRELLQNHYDVEIRTLECLNGEMRVILKVAKPDSDSAEFIGEISKAVDWAHHWAMHK